MNHATPDGAESTAPLAVGVFGAGAVGCYLGLRLSAAGCAVTLVGRGDEVGSRASLHAVDLRGRVWRAGAGLRATADVTQLAGVDVCLVAVKSQDTLAAAAALATVLPAHGLVVSFQNGLGNAARLREGGLRKPVVVGGMVSFNVVREDAAARVRQTTRGPLVAGAAPAGNSAAVLARLAAAFARTGDGLRVVADIDAILAGKLLINLGNGLSAVTGLPTAAALASADYRRCLVQCIREARAVFAAAGTHVAGLGAFSPALVTTLLGVPSPWFEWLAGPIVRVDPEARSSTLQDLDRGKPTEIDFLNGAVVALAERHGRDAPLNRWVLGAVHDLERAPRPLGFFSARAVRDAFAALGAATAAR